jgi:hypothetical protein
LIKKIDRRMALQAAFNALPAPNSVFEKGFP